MSIDILAQMYISLIRPQLGYAVAIWSGCTQLVIDKLQLYIHYIRFNYMQQE